MMVSADRTPGRWCSQGPTSEMVISPHGSPRGDAIRRLLANCLLSAFTLLLLFALGEAAFRLIDVDRQLEYDLDPEVYWKLRPNQTGYLWMGNGRSVEARINNLGLRGPNVDVNAHRRIRILALGDSYTFGVGVGDAETFCAVLERTLGPQRVEVINAGVPGYGIFQAERTLRRLATQLHPDVVLLTIPTGDVFRQPFATAEEERRYLETERTRLRFRGVSKLATWVYRKVYYLGMRFGWGVKIVPNEARADGDASFERLWRSDQGRLIAMEDLSTGVGAKLVVMVWPQAGEGTRNDVVTEGVRALAGDGVLALTRLETVLSRLPPEELVIPGDGHPAAPAHRAAGEYLAEALGEIL
jgi:GDSL-like Lipase/Acylhydrolase family